MDTKETKYVIDTEEAIKNIADLSAEYRKNAESLGVLYKEYGSAINEGQQLISSFTQLTSEGKAVTTTIRTTEEGVKNYKVAVVNATSAQLKFIERQKEMARIAEEAMIRAKANTDNPLITLTQDNKQALIEKFGKTGQALRRAIRDANEFRLSIERGNAALARLGGEGQAINAAAGLGKARVAAEQLKDALGGVAAFSQQINNIGIATTVYRGLSVAFQGIKSSLKDAGEFSREIALIQTLAQDSGETFDSWATSVRKVSDQFGTPIVDVATAAYEGLSSQVIHTTEDFNVLSAALSLGKTTKSDTVASLNVISSVINGFGLSTEEATRIADKLFTTIDIGNVKVDELATSIGRGAALAKQANSSYEELFAGIGVITQTGVSSAEAVTLLNNVFVQLSKPSETLRRKLQELNFATGQQAIGTLGLIGTLVELSKVAKDVPNGLAGLFPDIRGLRGAESLTGDAGKKFVETLDKITNSAGNTSRALKIVQDNSGDKLFSELERLKTFFTVDIGKPFLETVISTTDKVGGLSEVLKSLSIGIVGASAAMTAFRTASNLTNISRDVFTVAANYRYLRTELTAAQAATELFGEASAKSLGKFGTALTFVGVAAVSYAVVDAIFKYAVDRAKRAAEEEKRIAKEASDKKIELQREANVKILEDFDKSIKKQSQSFGNYVATQQELVTQGLKDSARETERIAQGLQNRFDLILGVLKNNVSDIESAQKKSADAIKDIREAQAKTQIEQAEQVFDRNTKLAEIERDRFIAVTGNKLKAYQDYTRKIIGINEQRIAFTKQQQVEAINRNDISTAEKLNSEIREILNGMQDMTIQSGNATVPLLNQQALQNRISQEAARFNQLLQSRVPQLEAEVTANAKLALQEKERVKTLEDMLKNTAKFSESVVKDGQFTPEFAKEPTKAIEGLEKLQRQARNFINEVGGLKNDQTLANLGISKDQLEGLFREQKKNLSDQINFATQQKALRDLSATQGEFVTKSRDGLEQVNKKITEQTQLYEKNRLKILEMANALKSQLPEAGIGTDKFNLLDQAINGLNNNLKIGSPKSAQENLNQLQRVLESVPAQVRDPLDLSKDATKQEAIDRFRALVSTMQALESQGSQSIQAAFQELAKIDPTNIQTTEQSLAKIYQITANATPVPGLDEAKAKLIQILTLLEQVRRSSAGTNFVGPPDLRGRADAKASGGVVGAGGFLSDFYSGRYRKGTDVVPTMLAKREVVVPERAAEKHAGLLQAIIGNRVPKAKGGQMVAQSVGSININMPGGTTAAQVRVIGRALHRAFKQGTMSLGN